MHFKVVALQNKYISRITVVESIHDGVCRIKAILANRSHVSFLGRDVGDSGLAVALSTSPASIF